MKIKSAWRDYYDWVANLYGGGDPRLVYARDQVFPMPEKLPHERVLSDTQRILQWRNVEDRAHWVYVPRARNVTIDGINYVMTHRLLIVAGKPYYFVQRDLDVTTKYNIRYMMDAGKRSEFEARAAQHQHEWRLVDGSEFVSVNSREYGDQSYERLARHLKAAAFIVDLNWNGDLVIDGHTPVLADYGFASIIDAQTMYQELALFVGSLIDEAPNPSMSDVQKIEAHGFDRRQSFRHRK